MTLNPPVLETRAVGMEFGDSDKTLPVLQDISLQVGAGEFLCIIGPSGCGKTTFLQMSLSAPWMP